MSTQLAEMHEIPENGQNTENGHFSTLFTRYLGPARVNLALLIPYFTTKKRWFLAQKRSYYATIRNVPWWAMFCAPSVVYVMTGCTVGAVPVHGVPGTVMVAATVHPSTAPYTHIYLVVFPPYLVVFPLYLVFSPYLVVFHPKMCNSTTFDHFCTLRGQ